MNAELKKTDRPFHFYTRLHLTELTGLRASTISDLLRLIKEVPGSCIYHHTHRFLQQHLTLSPEPPNDFAYWINESLGEDELGEMLASIDIISFPNIRSLREKLVETIEQYIEQNPDIKKKFASEDEAFYFIKSVSFVIPTHYVASDLLEFRDIINKITIDSIYYHIFESRLRLEKDDNDFSFWIETCMEDKQLADEISQLDPYTYTLEQLRQTIIKKIDERIKNNGTNK